MVDVVHQLLAEAVAVRKPQQSVPQLTAGLVVRLEEPGRQVFDPIHDHLELIGMKYAQGVPQSYRATAAAGAVGKGKASSL